MSLERKSAGGLTIRDRLEHGNLTVAEVCELASRSRSGFYEDVKAGRVAIAKIGRKTIVRGPVAAAYVASLAGAGEAA